MSIVQSLYGPHYGYSLKRGWLHMAERGTWSMTTVPYVANWPLLQCKGKHMNANIQGQWQTHNDKYTQTLQRPLNILPNAILPAGHNSIMPIPGIVILSFHTNLDPFRSPNCVAWHSYWGIIVVQEVWGVRVMTNQRPARCQESHLSTNQRQGRCEESRLPANRKPAA